MHSKPSSRFPAFQRLPLIILCGGVAKLFVDTTIQIYNPFLVVIAAGVGISSVGMGRIVALRSLAGLFAPLIGSIADRVGHRRVMRASLLIIGVGMIAAAASGNWILFAAAVLLTGIGHSGFTPNLHAYLSSRLPYEKRARGIGIVEYSWALAGIVGLYASGYLIEMYSWKAPFYVLGTALVALSLIFAVLPETEVRSRAAHRPARPGSLAGVVASARAFLRLGEHRRSAWAAIAVTGINMFAMMHVVIIHGGWLQAEYNLSPSGLGTVALYLGLSDLAASVIVSLFVDRIGKRKSVLIGVTGMSIGYALLPFLNRSLGLAILSIAVPRMSFEFAVVSNFPLLSEQAPQARGKIMSLAMAAGLVGAMFAGITGPAMYLRFGVWGLGPVSLIAASVSLFLLIVFVRERRAG